MSEKRKSILIFWAIGLVIAILVAMFRWSLVHTVQAASHSYDPLTGAVTFTGSTGDESGDFVVFAGQDIPDDNFEMEFTLVDTTLSGDDQFFVLQLLSADSESGTAMRYAWGNSGWYSGSDQTASQRMDPDEYFLTFGQKNVRVRLSRTVERVACQIHYALTFTSEDGLKTDTIGWSDTYTQGGATDPDGTYAFAFGIRHPGDTNASATVKDVTYSQILGEGTLCTHGHIWSEGRVTQTPTCGEYGVMAYSCTVCDAYKTGFVASLDHTDENADGVCDLCGETLDGDVYTVTYSWDNGSVSVKAKNGVGLIDDEGHTIEIPVALSSYTCDYQGDYRDLNADLTVTVTDPFIDGTISEPVSSLQKLSDGFFVAGVLVLGMGGLKFFRNKGAFDILSYGVSSVVYTAIPVLNASRPAERRDEDFYAYTQRKQGERKPAGDMIVAGAIHLAIAVVLLVACLVLGY